MTWGGYFDWFTGLPVTDARAMRESAQLWACTAFLTKDTDGDGYVLAAVDECPVNALTADLAIRRPQSFQPATGTMVHWMSCDQVTRRVLQSGSVTVGSDTVTRLPNVAVPKAPAAVRIIAATALDFGDAPVAFPSAQHAGDSAVLLGASVNRETSPNANDGDDGISAPAQWTTGTVVPVQITVSTACKLDGWVDWARNNAWSGNVLDAQDQIASSLSLTAGVNTLKVSVPTQAVPGTTFARFRVSLGGCLAPDGPAPDGEAR